MATLSLRILFSLGLLTTLYGTQIKSTPHKAAQKSKLTKTTALPEFRQEFAGYKGAGLP